MSFRQGLTSQRALGLVLVAFLLLFCTGCKKRYVYRFTFTNLLHPTPPPTAVTVHGRPAVKDVNGVLGVQFARGEANASEDVTLTYASPCGPFTVKVPASDFRVNDLGGLDETEVLVNISPPQSVDVYFDPQWVGHTMDEPHEAVREGHPISVTLGECRTLKIDGKAIALPKDLGVAGLQGSDDGFVLLSRGPSACYRTGVAVYGCGAGDEDVERLEGKDVYFIKKKAPTYFFTPIEPSVLVNAGTPCDKRVFVSHCTGR